MGSEMCIRDRRGGPLEPLSDEELYGKYRSNCAYGGWNESQIDALQSFCDGIGRADNMDGLVAFRG